MTRLALLATMLIAAWCCCLVETSAAAAIDMNKLVHGLQGIIVDTDASPESLAALTTIAVHSEGQEQLAFVTVSGNGWSSLYDTQRIVRLHLDSLGLDNVPVFRGAARPLAASSADATTTSKLADCLPSLIPLCGEDAAAAGLHYSRYNMDTIFGAIDSITPGGAVGRAFDLPDTPAEEVILQLITYIRARFTRIKYISLSGLTNIALALRKARLASQTSGTDLLGVAVGKFTIHIVENGNNLGLDPVASKDVLTTPHLHRILYTQKFTNSVRFTPAKWDHVVKSHPNTQKGVRWLLQTVLKDGLKSYLDKTPDDAKFFNTFSLGPSLVAMVAVDSYMKGTFVPYRGKLLEVVGLGVDAMPQPKAPAPTAPGANATTSEPIETMTIIVNATSPTKIAPVIYLSLETDATHTDGTEIVDASAAVPLGGYSTALVETFWMRWFSVLGM